MGNCLTPTSRVQNAHSSQHSSVPSKATSKSSLSSVPSSLTCSTASTLTVPSCSERSYEAPPTPRTEGEILASSNVKAFTFSELKSASRNFRPDSLLGEGGFGYVFKAWIDEYTFAASKPGSGMVVAIKKLKPEGFQGHKEWLTEVQYLGQLHHPNLVKLIGYCSEGDHRLLVYEYMPKGSLENHLFKRRLSAKADVYSFGVVLLELLSGRRGLDKNKVGIEQNLVDWARPSLGDKRKLFRIMDSRLEAQYPKKAAHTVAALALRCISNEAKLRPKMSEVLAVLEPLQDPKEVVERPMRRGDKRKDTTNPVLRSPMRGQASQRRGIGVSPLAPHQQSPLVH